MRIMKKLTLHFLLILMFLMLFMSTLYASSYSYVYTIAPGNTDNGPVTAKLELTSGYYTTSLEPEKQQTTFSYTYNGKTPTEITIHNSSDQASGAITASDKTYKEGVTCTVTFYLTPTKDEPDCWHPWGNTAALSTDYASSTIGVGPPASNSNSSLYQILNPQVVYLVDYNSKTGNMLFRGNLPFTNGATPTSEDQRIDFNALDKAFKDLIKYNNLEVPDKYNFIDIPLIGGVGADGAKLMQEYALFNKNKLVCPPAKELSNILNNNLPNNMNQAQMLWWETNPGTDPASIENIKDLDNKLIELMSNTMSQYPTFLYIHCVNGHDRTAIAACTYLGNTYKNILPSEDYSFVYGTTVRYLDPTIYSASQFGNTVLEYPSETKINNLSRIMPISTSYTQTIENVLGVNFTDTYTANNNHTVYGFDSVPWKQKSDGEL